MFQPLSCVVILIVSCCINLSAKGINSLIALQSPNAATLPPQTKEPETLLQGRAAYVKGEFENAVFNLKQASESPLTPEQRAVALYYLGRSYYSLKQYEEALISYGKLLHENPNFVLVHYEQGKVYLAQENYVQAAEQYAHLRNISRRLQAEEKQRAEDSAPPQLSIPVTIIAVTGEPAQHLAEELAVYLADLFPPEEAIRYQIPVVPLIPGFNPNVFSPLSAVAAMGKDGVGRPTILSREKARYTEAARLNCVQGTVVLSTILVLKATSKKSV